MKEHQRGGGVTIAECDQPVEIRSGFAECGDSGGDIVGATLEAVVHPFSVADAASVVPEYGIAIGGETLSQCSLPAISAAADFVAAADDQQAGRAIRPVERSN